MNGAAKTSSVRIIPKLGVALGAVLLLLLAGLLAAPGAQALGATPGEAGAPAEQAAPPAGEQAPPAEQAKPPAEETKPPAEETKPPAEETKPPAEETKPPAEETKPPAEETKPAPPAEEATPPVQTSPVKEAPPTLEETPAEQEKKPAARASSEGSSNPQSGGASQPNESAAVPPVVTALLGGGEPELSRSHLSGPAAWAESRKASGGAAAASCGASSLPASMIGSCAELWLSAPGGSSASSIPVVVSASWPTRAIDGGAVASPGQHPPVSLQSPPSSPRPGPAPGGSGGVAAAGGGSGAALSALTSVAASLRIAEIASRQPLLDQPSWRTPFFVLIPERPG